MNVYITVKQDKTFQEFIQSILCDKIIDYCTYNDNDFPSF